MRIEGVENGQSKSSEWRMRRARLLSGLTEAERRRRALYHRLRMRREQIYEDSLIFGGRRFCD